MQPEIVDAGGMTLKEARRLLGLSRQVRWSFPSSLGRPVRWEPSEPWVESVKKERISFVKAVTFLMRNGQADAALEIAANVWRLWVLTRDNEGGRRLLAQVLDRGSRKQTRARALALYGDSLLAFRQGRIDESKRRSEEALEVAKSVVDPEALSLANLALSRVAFEDGDYKLALFRAREARRLACHLDSAFAQAPLFMEAQSARMLGDYGKAASLFGESIDLNKRIGDKGMVIAELNNLGLVEIHRNNVDAAERLFEESERISGSKDDNPYSKAVTHLNKAMIAFKRGHISQAKSLLVTTKSTFERSMIEPARDDKFEIDWLDRELARGAS